MGKYAIPYGDHTIPIELDTRKADVFLPNEIEPAADGLAEVKRALDHPCEGLSLKNFSGARSAAIAINDKTRPVPHLQQLLPLLDLLNVLGIPDREILLLVAVGTHRPASPEEIAGALPSEITSRVKVLSHDCDDAGSLVDLGKTSRGTPLYLNRRFYEADLRIVTGNIEPHHFMGFSGGVKTACIGLAGRQTIAANHTLLSDPRAVIGSLEGNPMRQDLEEMGRMAGIHYALNTILTDDRRIVRAFAGSPQAVIEAGVLLSRGICEVKLGRLYDLTITSPGGYPKDINLYQAQKAISHAALFTRPGGAIVLAAECRDGSGSPGFEEFMQGVGSPGQALEKFSREGFRIGPHKAFQIARQVEDFAVYLVSSIPDEQVRQYMLRPAVSISDAINQASNDQQEPGRIAILPFATHLIARAS